jgi:hypothetical protein
MLYRLITLTSENSVFFVFLLISQDKQFHSNLQTALSFDNYRGYNYKFKYVSDHPLVY